MTENVFAIRKEGGVAKSKFCIFTFSCALRVLCASKFMHVWTICASLVIETFSTAGKSDAHYRNSCMNDISLESNSFPIALGKWFRLFAIENSENASPDVGRRLTRAICFWWEEVQVADVEDLQRSIIIIRVFHTNSPNSSSSTSIVHTIMKFKTFLFGKALMEKKRFSKKKKKLIHLHRKCK